MKNTNESAGWMQPSKGLETFSDNIKRSEDEEQQKKLTSETTGVLEDSSESTQHRYLNQREEKVGLSKDN